MVLSLRRLIVTLFGSDQVEQVDAIRRSGAERAAQRQEVRDERATPPAGARTAPAGDETARRDEAGSR